MRRRVAESIVVVLIVATLVWAASSFTANLNLEKPAQGDLNWHTAVNGNMDILDGAFDGFLQNSGTPLTEERVPYVETGTSDLKDEAGFEYNETTNTLKVGALDLTTPLPDSEVADNITASNYLPLAGGTLTGQVVASNLGIEFTESDTNPTCAAGNFSIYADLSELKLKQCVDGSASDIGAGGGGAPTDATYITQTANGTLSAEQALSSLSTGIMRVATTTGVVTSLTDSAGIAANISDETGTGALCFADSPVFTTKIRPPSATAFPGSPSAGDVVVITDDSAIGACDSAAGSARSLCRYSGSAWQSLGDGGGGGGSPGGSNTHVQFNNGGAFGGSANFVWDNTNKIMTLTNNAAFEYQGLVLSNTNTGSGADVSMRISSNTTNGGDPKLVLNINGSTNWTLGVDNDQGNRFVISGDSTAPGSGDRLALDETSTAGNTALLLWDVDNATLERVTVGAADSCGAGFKCLRIPN